MYMYAWYARINKALELSIKSLSSFLRSVVSILFKEYYFGLLYCFVDHSMMFLRILSAHSLWDSDWYIYCVGWRVALPFASPILLPSSAS